MTINTISSSVKFRGNQLYAIRFYPSLATCGAKCYIFKLSLIKVTVITGGNDANIPYHKTKWCNLKANSFHISVFVSVDKGLLLQF